MVEVAWDEPESNPFDDYDCLLNGMKFRIDPPGHIKFYVGSGLYALAVASGIDESHLILITEP